MTHKGTVTLETERLILRRFTMDDAETMFANWCTDSEVTKYLMWSPHSSIDVTRQTLNTLWLSNYDKPDFYQWAIELKEIGEPIGSIGIMKHDDKTRMVHFGYCLGKAWWHKGYMSEALICLVKFFFEDVGANRIESRHDPRNPNSGKVMQKAGLRYEGTSRESDWNNQGICDAANYAVLASDYFQKTQPALSIQATCRKADISDFDSVTDLLCELYNMGRDELSEENKKHFDDEKQVFFLALDGGKSVGVAHGALRSEYINGTKAGGTIGYLEGVYVKAEYRMNGIAAALVRMCEEWAKTCGCQEFASDCLIHNTDSYKFHLSLGFDETERCIFFRKELQGN